MSSSTPDTPSEKITFNKISSLVGKTVEFSRIRRDEQQNWETDPSTSRETGIMHVIESGLYHIQANGYWQTVNQESFDALQIEVID